MPIKSIGSNKAESVKLYLLIELIEELLQDLEGSSASDSDSDSGYDPFSSSSGGTSSGGTSAGGGYSGNQGADSGYDYNTGSSGGSDNSDSSNTQPAASSSNTSSSTTPMTTGSGQTTPTTTTSGESVPSNLAADDAAAKAAGILMPTSVVASALPSGFQGTQTGIGSWYDASSSRDSTNGHSWVGYPYQNNSDVFAPSLLTMEDGSVVAYGTPGYEEAIKQYAGQQAIVTDPETGKSLTMYIGDAFDPKWVRSPGSIDIMSGAWSYLTGQSATNKDDVIDNVTWQLTGNKATNYAAGGSGDP